LHDGSGHDGRTTGMMMQVGRYSFLGALAAASFALGCAGESSPESETLPQDVTLPDPGPDGFQIGTDIIDVAPGAETQQCYFFEVPFDRPVDVHRITLAQNIGSHHMNVFRVKSVVNLDGAPGEVVKDGECWKSPNWADWPIVANSQSSGEEDWELPAGVALKLAPREKLMLQSHYVNATTQTTPTHGKGLVNFYGLPEGSQTEELGTLFATNQNIEICPGNPAPQFSATCPLAKEGPITVVAAAGHFHSRGKRFTMNTYSSTTGAAGEQFYESTAWNEPPFTRDLNVQIPMGDQIQWTCEYTPLTEGQCGDPAKNCCYTFGGLVETQEHCNAFVYYYPRGSTDRNCF
jgi:hypothetical protein